MDSLIGKQLGQYEIRGQLGEGGMAAVYRARQTSVDRDVAIKIIRPDLVNTSGFLERFRREAKTVAALSHLHILKVFDYGSAEGLAYLVMELIDGGNLSRLIQNAGALPMDQAARLLTQIASALDYAHAKGIIHRDLKPENVLLDQQGNAFLTDFGIARLVDANTSAITQAGAVMGTPAYMAPEVWQGEPADARTDIYALGVLLYNMLTGRAAFSADTPYAIMFKHMNELPVAASSLNREVWPTVDQVINTALAKQRVDRFNTAGEMAASFRQAIRVDSSGTIPIPTPSKGINLTASATVLGGLPASTTPQSAAATTRAGRNEPPRDEPPTLATQRPAGQPARRVTNRWLFFGALVTALVVGGIGVTAWLSSQQDRTNAALALALDQTRTADSVIAQQAQVATQTAVAIQQIAAQTGTQAAGASLVAILPTATQTAAQPPTIDPAVIAELTRLAQPTVTPTASITPTATPSLTSTVTPSQTPTLTATATSTATPTVTQTPSLTFTPSPTVDLALLAAQTLAPILTATAQRNQLDATLAEGSRRLDSTRTAIALAGTAAAQSFASTQTLAAFNFGMTQTAQAQVVVVTATPNTSVVVTNCPNALPSRLIVGGTGRVTPGDPNRLRNAPSFAGRYIGQMPGGSTFVIKEGPTCGDGIAWWLVAWNGIEGWTAEGQNGTYWLEPVGADGNTVSVSCSGFQIPSRLRIGGTGKVRKGGISNALNSNPSRPSVDPNSIRLGSIPQGQTFIVLDGPVCGADGILWWKVNYNGRVGWTGEGQGTEYWVEPVSS